MPGVTNHHSVNLFNKITTFIPNSYIVKFSLHEKCVLLYLFCVFHNNTNIESDVETFVLSKIYLKLIEWNAEI